MTRGSQWLTAVFSLLALGATSAPGHWAYQPPKPGALPAVRDASWPRNDVDLFILAKLDSKGGRPASDASKTALIRRAYFDLIGLPPGPEEIEAFLQDSSADAFANLVDRLLASPHFGERWGRHWLDVVRYGESVTLRGFIFKEAWRYRDYVIQSFNNDLRYDEFLREQVAGDLLPSSTLAERQGRIVATTFLVLGNTNFEEQDKKQLEMDVVDEQLDTIGKAFLAQTIGCARCHDHKFDPIPTRDYYAMAGILKSVKVLEHENVSKWLEFPLPVEPELETKYKEHEAAVAALQKEIKEARARAAKASGTTAVGMPLAIIELPGIVVDDAQARRVGHWVHSQYAKNYVGDGYLHDDNKEKGARTITFQPEIARAGRYEVRLAYTPAPNRATKVGAHILHADGETTVFVNEQETPALGGRFASLGQFRFEANGQGYVLISNEGTDGYVIADAVQFLPAETVESIAVSSKKVPDDDVKPLEAKLKQLVDGGLKRPMFMSVKEGDVGDTHVHIRGTVNNLGEKVPRGFLQVATTRSSPAVPENESGRRELADWLASRDNPLTARVIVNRVWHWLFDAGLVRTTDNFGTTGETASHPELLDYLALRFMDDGWSIKRLVRLIMTSRTYQLSTELAGRGVPAEPSGADPENRLLWRMNRKRLDAECIRDSILAVSGQLTRAVGGPTIKPGTSADYGYRFTEPRRSVYVPVLRNALPELFEAFDFADPSAVTGRRNVSTVAPQALFLMNHPFVIEQAELAAKHLLKQTHVRGHARLDHAYRMTLGRPPTEGERTLTLRHLNDSDDVRAWTQIFQALFASIDFRYLN